MLRRTPGTQTHKLALACVPFRSDGRLLLERRDDRTVLLSRARDVLEATIAAGR